MAAKKARTTAAKRTNKAPAAESLVDKVIGLIKWVDNPFKLFTVIIIASMTFLGYMTWESRQVILAAITSHHAEPTLKDEAELVEISQQLFQSLGAELIVIHQVNLMVNTRTTRVALDRTGRNKEIEGTVTSVFNENPNRNRAVVAMLAGEVQCDNLVPSSRVGQWFAKNGVTFVCRGSIPPDVGKFAGYVTVGFKEAPADIIGAKSVLQQASARMAR